MSPRIDRPEFAALTPGVSEALMALGKALKPSGLGEELLELIMLRASQLNGCAFCLQVHLNMARHIGLDPARLDQLAAWRESPVYSARERVALAWTESLTLAPQGGPNEDQYQEALAEFGAGGVSYLTAAIANINAWNRIALGLRFAPPQPKSA